MGMRIDHPGHEEFTLKIDPLRRRAGNPFDVRQRAHRDDFVPTDGQRSA